MIAAGDDKECSTRRTYAAPLRRWAAFCTSTGASIHEPAIGDVVTFIGAEMGRTTRLSTLRTSISAVSSILIDPARAAAPHNSLFNHPLVKKALVAFVKTHRVECAPRDAQTLDLAKLVAHIESRGDPKTMRLVELAQCCAVLVRIHTRHRSSDLARYALASLVRRPDAITGYISAPKDIPRKQQSKWSRKFEVRKSASATSAFGFLSLYLDRSARLRVDGPHEKSRIFIGSRPPYRAAAASTIAGWCMIVLRAAGVDEGHFRAHDICAAAASYARNVAKISKKKIEANRWARGSKALEEHYLEPCNDAGREVEESLVRRSHSGCFGVTEANWKDC
jgi:hypothetical protein